MASAPKVLYEFGPFRIDPDKQLLLRDKRPVPVTSKTFDTLLILVRHSREVVSKEDLMNELWPDSFVEEANLKQNIFMLRKALGDSPEDRRYIVTLPGKGYRFVAEVRTVTQDGDDVIVTRRSSSQMVVGHTGSATVATSLALPTRKSRRFNWKYLLAVGVVFAVAAFVGWRFLRPRPEPFRGRIMLAILPFENLTGDPAEEYFADGLTEEMITQVGHLPNKELGVIARTSVMPYKHTDKRLDQIGRELGVQYVLEGSVRRATGHVRVTAQLISVADQTHLWEEDFDSEPQDVLAIQDAVAAAVARQMQLKLAPDLQAELSRSHSVNPEAHEAYLKGRYFWNKRTKEGFSKALEFFELSIQKDPAYAEAYAGLADSYLLLGGYGYEVQADTMPKAKAAALRAIALDDRLAEPYTTLGLIYEQYDWNWAESEKSFKRAIALNPNYSVAHHWYGAGYLPLVGKTGDVITELRRAHELDPLSLMIAVDLAHWLCVAGDYNEGMMQFGKVLEIDPHFIQAHYYLSMAYEQKGDYAAAIAEANKIEPLESIPYIVGQLGYVYAKQGDRHRALDMVRTLQEASTQHNVDPGYFARIYIALGDKDQAFVWLEKGFRQHSATMTGLKCERVFDPIRADPRFSDLVRRVGIP